MYQGIWHSITFMLSFSIIVDNCSSIIMVKLNILSNGLTIIVKSDNGNTMSDINGTNIMLFIGVRIFIS